MYNRELYKNILVKKETYNLLIEVKKTEQEKVDYRVSSDVILKRALEMYKKKQK